MSIVHFKLTFNFKTHRFVRSTDRENLFDDVKKYVANVVGSTDFKLYWNDDDSNVVLGSADDLLTALDFANSSLPPCVQIIVVVPEQHQMESHDGVAETLEKAQQLPIVQSAFAELHAMEPNQRLQITSMLFKHDTVSDKATVVLHFDSPADFSLWEKFFKAGLATSGYDESCLDSYYQRRLTVTASSATIFCLIGFTHYLASRTNIQHVRVTGSVDDLSIVSYYLKNSSVQQLTLQQKTDEVDQFDHWLEFVQVVQPTKLRVERLECTLALGVFLVKAARVVESMWIGGLGADGPVPITLIGPILAKKCSYLHIRDKFTKVTLTEIESLAMCFQDLSKKVSLAIPTAVRALETEIEDYSVKKATGLKYRCEQDLLIIEHREMCPKAEEMC